MGIAGSSVGQVAAFELRGGADAAVHAIGDGECRHIDVVTDGVTADDAQLIVVLEEASRAAAHVGRMRAAEDFERRHLDRGDVEPRFVRHDLRVRGFEHRARQRHRERLADRDRARARLPPAANGFNAHHLLLFLCRKISA